MKKCLMKTTCLKVHGICNSWFDTNLQRPQNQIHKKMTKDANYEGSSQQPKEDLINRRNGQGPEHLKFFLPIFLNI